MKDRVSVLYLYTSFAVSHPPPFSSVCFYIQVDVFDSTWEQIISYYWTTGAISWLAKLMLDCLIFIFY